MSKRNILKTALIRNARVCSDIENFGHNTTFEIERENHGWDFIQNSTLYGVSGGFAFLSATTFSPSLSRSNGFAAVEAGEYTEVVVKFKYKNVSSYYATTKGRIYFATSSDPLFTEEKSVQFDVTSDDAWHVYTVDMAPVNKWVGFVNNLKVVFADGEGVHGDEIFLEYIRIQSPVFSFCTSDCIESSSSLSLEDNFDSQNLGTAPEGWSLIDTLTGDRTVSITRDPDNFVNKVVSITNGSATDPGPSMLKVLPGVVGTGTFSCRFRPTAAEGILTLYATVLGTEEVVKLRIHSDNSLQYKEGLIFRDFDTTPEVDIGEWNDLMIQLDLASQRIDVYLNGNLVGQDIAYLFPKPIYSIKVENIGTAINTLYVDDIMVVEHIDGENSCPGIGRRGSLEGAEVAFIFTDIIEGVNDTMLVNLNGYGDVRISIPERKGVSREELRRMVERELSVLDIGGYPFCEVSYFLETGTYLIRSGTYGFDSSVVVKQDGDSTLAFLMGFVDEFGAQLGESLSGRPHAASFQSSNTFLAHSVNLLEVVEERSDVIKLYQDPTLPTNEIGSRVAGSTSRLNTLIGTNKTYVDFYHRATGEGRIDEISFHGELPRTPAVKITSDLVRVSVREVHFPVDSLDAYGVVVGDLLIIDEPGYAGNGSYAVTQAFPTESHVEIETPLPLGTGLTVRIQTVAKLKHLRPDLDGNLTVVTETSVGVETAGRLYSRVPDTYTVDVDWYLHRGDFIGIYNASKIYVGNDLNSNPQAIYQVYEGDLVGSNVKMPTPEGAGIRGIGLYGHTNRKKNRAVYDITFDEAEAIEFLDIEGKVFPEIREYSLVSALDSGFSMDVTVTGTHVHKIFNTLTALYEYDSHQNIAYNESALTDGVQYASHGLLGEFEQDVDDAVYFYVSGDGEFTPTDPGDTDAIEYPIGGNRIHEQILEYYMDSIDFDMTWNVPKTVHRFKVFFKQYPNVDNHSLEWLRDSRFEFDGTRKGYERIGLGNTSEFVEINLDKLRLHSDDLGEVKEFIKHFQTVFNAEIGSANVSAGSTVYAYNRNPFTILNKEFDPVTTSSMRWHVGAHRSTKISEIELFSSTDSNAALNESVELFFSLDGVTFQRAEVNLIGDTKVRFDIGLPVKSLRLVVNPGTLIGLYNITGIPADDTVRYLEGESESTVNSVDLDIRKGTVSPATKLLIKNGDCFTSSVDLSIDTEELSDSIILKSTLHTEEETLNPEVGPKGILLLDEDANLRVTNNVAINAQHYGLKNLAAGAKFYEATRFENESNYFRTGLTFNKWLPSLFENFPQDSAGDTFSPGGIIDYGTTLPGFNLESGTFPPDSPANPSPATPINATIISKWNILGSCAAFIECSIDPRGTNANPRSIVIGLVDGTGRELYIEKAVTKWRDHSPQTNKDYSHFNVVDSDIGTVQSYMSFHGAGTYDDIGVDDAGVSFFLKIERSVDITGDVLKFSYTDTVNGSGEFEWNGSLFYSLDLSGTPLVGPIKAFIRHHWAIKSYHPGGVLGLVSGITPHNRVYAFNFSGVTNYSSSHIEFGPAQLAGPNGEINRDNRQSTILADSARAIAVDLGNTYSLDILHNYTVSGSERWNVNFSEFSSSQVDDPESVQWGNSSINNVRWILFKEDPVPMSTVSGLKYLDTLRVYPDITQIPPYRLDNSEWTSISGLLTDGDSSTAYTQLDYPVIAVDLGELFNTSYYTIRDKTGEEFPSRTSFAGWYADTYYTQSSATTDDPKKAVWDSWLVQSSNKSPKPAKWHCFKNETFDPSDGLTNPRNIATLAVSTFGTRTSGDGEFKDAVDFTEYATWFDTPHIESYNSAAVLEEDREAVELLFDTSTTKQNAGEDGDKWSIFDEDLSSNLVLTGDSHYIWRVFGTLSGTIDDTPTVVSGEIFASDGSTVTDQSVVFSGTEISAFEVAVSSGSVGFPDRITIQTLTGTDPAISSNWTTLSTENGLVEENVSVSGTDTLISVFNGGVPYSITLADPVTVSGFKVLFEDVVYGTGQVLKDISVEEVKSFSPVVDPVSSIISIDNDHYVRHNGRRSLKLTYNSGHSANSFVTTGAAMLIDTDEQWSVQDYLQFHMKVENSELLDLENCFIKLGTDKDTFYAWPFSALQGDLSSVELNSYQLKFLDAPEKGIPGITVNSEDRSDLESKVDLVEGPIQFMQVELKPKTTAQEDIVVWLDDLSVKRETFSIPGRDGTTLYLNNSELLYYPLAEFDIKRGFFEAVITPDWNSDADTTIQELESFTIFTAINDLDESFSCTYSCFNFGLIFIIGTQTKRYNLLVGELSIIEKYKPFKLSVSWDAEGSTLDSESGTTLRVWINDQRVVDFTTTWDMRHTQTNYFFIGGKVPEVDVALNIAEEYDSTVPGKIVPNLKSVTGGIENIILSKYPSKVAFEDTKTLKDKIEVSVDGVNFYKGSDSVFPMTISSVGPGDSFPVWIRTNLPKDTTNLARKAFLRTRWQRS